MTALRKQEICGHIRPLRFDHQTISGQVYPLIDWKAIANRYKPDNCVNYIFKGQLEYLQCDYYIKSLPSIQSKDLPVIDEIEDTKLEKQNKYAEFKRKFGVKSGYAVELMLHTKWTSEEWSFPKAGEFLRGLGQYGYLNLFDPYLLRDAEILYSDPYLEIGASLYGQLEGLDAVEINGGYSGHISYYEDPDYLEPLQENANSVIVGRNPVLVANSRNNRKMFFVSNDGNNRLYFRFTSSPSAVSTNCPFLEPGETLSIEFDKASWSGGNEHQWMKNATRHYLPQPLYAIRDGDSGKVCYQEFY